MFSEQALRGNYAAMLEWPLMCRRIKTVFRLIALHFLLGLIELVLIGAIARLFTKHNDNLLVKDCLWLLVPALVLPYIQMLVSNKLQQIKRDIPQLARDRWRMVRNHPDYRWMIQQIEEYHRIVNEPLIGAEGQEDARTACLEPLMEKWIEFHARYLVIDAVMMFSS